MTLNFCSQDGVLKVIPSLQLGEVWAHPRRCISFNHVSNLQIYACHGGSSSEDDNSMLDYVNQALFF